VGAVAIIDATSIPARLMRAVINHHISDMVQVLVNGGAVETSCLVSSFNHS